MAGTVDEKGSRICAGRLTLADFSAHGGQREGFEKEAAMTIHDAQADRVTQRAYEFAMSGAFESMAALERQLVLEGFGHNLWWLERPGVRRTLAEISVTSRRLQASAERPSI
jgi:hypothetical protein